MTSRVEGYPLDQSWRIAAGECPLMTIEEARSRIRRALDLVRTVGVTFTGPLVLAIEALFTDDACRCLAALAKVEAILDSGCVAHSHFLFARAAINQALGRGDWDRAGGYAARLERYARSEQLPWSDYLIARGRAAAAWGRGTRSSELTTQLDRVQSGGAK